MRSNTVYVLVAVVMLALMIYAVHSSMKVPSNLPYAQSTLRIARQLAACDVGEVVIILDGRPSERRSGRMLKLERGRDDRDIALLLDGIKRSRVAKREVNTNNGDMIMVKKTDHSGGLTIQGCFDPDVAPVISDTLESDDLGKIVYGIFRRRGIEPRGERR